MFKVLIKSFFVATLVALLLIAVIFLPAIDQNSQQEYCVITASVSSVIDEVDNTFVKDGFRYRKYDPSLDKGVSVFYIPRKDSQYPIFDSNWSSQSRPCVLKAGVKAEARNLFGLVFLLVLVISATFLNFVKKPSN